MQNNDTYKMFGIWFRLKMSEMQMRNSPLPSFILFCFFVDECVSGENRFESSTSSELYKRNELMEIYQIKRNIWEREATESVWQLQFSFSAEKQLSSTMLLVLSCSVSFLTDFDENVVQKWDRKTYSENISELDFQYGASVSNPVQCCSLNFRLFCLRRLRFLYAFY